MSPYINVVSIINDINVNISVNNSVLFVLYFLDICLFILYNANIINTFPSKFNILNTFTEFVINLKTILYINASGIC